MIAIKGSVRRPRPALQIIRRLFAPKPLAEVDLDWVIYLQEASCTW